MEDERTIYETINQSLLLVHAHSAWYKERNTLPEKVNFDEPTRMGPDEKCLNRHRGMKNSGTLSVSWWTRFYERIIITPVCRQPEIHVCMGHAAERWSSSFAGAYTFHPRYRLIVRPTLIACDSAFYRKDRTSRIIYFLAPLNLANVSYSSPSARRLSMKLALSCLLENRKKEKKWVIRFHDSSKNRAE